MLFPYQYVNHSMEKMQEFIDYIFYEIWCEAPNLEYDVTLFDKNTDLKDIIVSFHYTDLKGAEFFIKGIQEIFLIFKTLSINHIALLKFWYRSNNDIESLCKNHPMVKPSTYSVIDRLNKDLSPALKAFFERLYSDSFLSLKVLSDKIGFIEDHYKKFVKINSKGKCPFCGLNDVDSQYVHTREAYDHYLPKSKYPFASINLKNLAPICYKCNSGYKLSKDPLHDSCGTRRKAFYSYNPIPYVVKIDILLDSLDIDDMTPEDINITFGPDSLVEELETWKEVFGIEERYKAKCCSADAKYWVTQILDECGDIYPNEFLHIRFQSAQRFPYSDTNFLRKPFLEACEAHHVFEFESRLQSETSTKTLSEKSEIDITVSRSTTNLADLILDLKEQALIHAHDKEVG